MATAPFSVLFGLICLFIGGEALVKGAASLARRLGLPELFIALTVVAFGTSSPELLISVKAAIEGHPDIALGNVIGSNIANILLIIGITALCVPIALTPRIGKFDLRAMLMMSFFLTFLVVKNVTLVPVLGGAFLVMLVLYILFSYFEAQRKGREEKVKEATEIGVQGSLLTEVFSLLVGMVFLVYGAQFFVDGSVEIARILGVSEAVIGVTLVAIGSSAPELVTSLIAAFKRHPEIALGNIIGSNIFNILGVLGAASLASPLSISPMFASVDIWVMAISATVFFVMLYTMQHFSRLMGLVFFLSYLGYVYYDFTQTAL